MAVAIHTWQPIVSGAEQGRVLEVVGDIADALRARYTASAPDDAYTLVDGRAGAALLHAYLGVALDDAGMQEATVRLLEEALDAASQGPQSVSLYGGFTGVAWVLAHLDGRLIDLGQEDPNDAIDQALLRLVSAVPWTGDYDLIAGLVGIGVYALERLPRPAARACLEAVVDRLAELAEPRANGVTWWTAPKLLPGGKRNRGHYNLGVAHGVPGVIALLGRACAAGVAEATARPLLDDAVSWLLAQNPPDEGDSFPILLEPDEAPEPARSAWCYGDPGVAATLLLAARAVGEPIWEAEALAIARRAAARPVAESGVVDASLCHGAVGLAHIFNRIFQTTDEPAFADAARYWLDRALAYRRPGLGIGGFGAVRETTGGEHDWQPDAGLLFGAAGVGLALLAAATPLEPSWDRLLLLT
jgi:lantibiotic modifying enzyme